MRNNTQRIELVSRESNGSAIRRDCDSQLKMLLIWQSGHVKNFYKSKKYVFKICGLRNYRSKLIGSIITSKWKHHFSTRHWQPYDYKCFVSYYWMELHYIDQICFCLAVYAASVFCTYNTRANTECVGFSSLWPKLWSLLKTSLMEMITLYWATELC